MEMFLIKEGLWDVIKKEEPNFGVEECQKRNDIGRAWIELMVEHSQ